MQWQLSFLQFLKNLVTVWVTATKWVATLNQERKILLCHTSLVEVNCRRVSQYAYLCTIIKCIGLCKSNIIWVGYYNWIQFFGGKLNITVYCFLGGPASQAGVKPGDYIMKVNGTPVSKFNHKEVVQIIKCEYKLGLSTQLLKNVEFNALQ